MLFGFPDELAEIALIENKKIINGALFLLALLAFVPCLAFADDGSRLILHRGDTDHIFTVEIADTPKSWASGLMFRKHLAEDAGMLFIYPAKQKISMWMKNTFISLDMLFIDRDGTIQHISERTVPLSTSVISSRYRVKAVLEVTAGTVARLGIRVGDRVEHSRLSPAD